MKAKCVYSFHCVKGTARAARDKKTAGRKGNCAPAPYYNKEAYTPHEYRAVPPVQRAGRNGARSGASTR
ncbi:MAG: hypothetical protein J6C31_04270 [Prevotella sp.]|nr:hypothetical protein [Prevotella sp.]